MEKLSKEQKPSLHASIKEACNEAIEEIYRKTYEALDEDPLRNHPHNMYKFSNTKEKLMHIMSDSTAITFEDIILRYISEFKEEFPLSRLSKLSLLLNEVMFSKTQDYESALHLSREGASYLSSYLNGKMYKDEESMEENMSIQAGHAEIIIQLVDRAFDKINSENKE